MLPLEKNPALDMQTRVYYGQPENTNCSEIPGKINYRRMKDITRGPEGVRDTVEWLCREGIILGPQ